MNANLMNLSVENKKNYYPNLLNRVDASKNCVKALLPFLKKYPFDDAFLRFHCLENDIDLTNYIDK